MAHPSTRPRRSSTPHTRVCRTRPISGFHIPAIASARCLSLHRAHLVRRAGRRHATRLQAPIPRALLSAAEDTTRGSVSPRIPASWRLPESLRFLRTASPSPASPSARSSPPP
ncbi:hypothetical protein CLOP_g8712 [Closterium sp. NIES-67]|nr:hypothetical protein CLOP_g8712 [Closterium sp. NIES-67]